jgi:hypothetical protein
MTFGLLKDGKHKLIIGQARPWESKDSNTIDASKVHNLMTIDFEVK